MDLDRAWLSVMLLLSAFLAACGSASPTTTGALPQSFRSEAGRIEITLPGGWAGSEGPEYLASPFEGLAAFNSWGEADFWAREVETRTAQGLSYSYSIGIVRGQIPADGAYIVLVEVGGPQRPAGSGPEYNREDLSELWKGQDCREKGGVQVNFVRWGRSLRLEVYCGPEVSGQTTAEVNDLLDSWRFDAVQTSAQALEPTASPTPP